MHQPTPRIYLPDVSQTIHDQAVLSVFILIQLQHGAAVLVQEEALVALISRVKGIHNDGLCAFDLTATERTTLAIWLLQHRRKGEERVSMKQEISCKHTGTSTDSEVAHHSLPVDIYKCNLENVVLLLQQFRSMRNHLGLWSTRAAGIHMVKVMRFTPAPYLSPLFSHSWKESGKVNWTHACVDPLQGKLFCNLTTFIGPMYIFHMAAPVKSGS